MTRQQIIVDNERIEVDEVHAYLCADVTCSERVVKMWYRFPIEYKEYICWERADAFLTGLLYYAMIYDYDIVLKSPVSEKLLFQLETYYIPTLVGTTDFFHHINIIASADSKAILNQGCVGTALSCGVDSFYSILQSMEFEYKKYRVTHVLFTDIPATVFSDELREKWLNENVEKSQKVSQEMGLKFILCETNQNVEFAIDSFYSPSKVWVANEGLASLQYCSSVFALQKLFSIYYLGSAGYKLDEVEIVTSSYDVLWHDFFSMPCITTENLTFYSSGVEASRIEKIKFISNYDITKQYLFACGMPTVNNCGRCSKCIRTMAELYVLGKLDEYDKVYPIDEFKKHYIKNMAVILSYKDKPFNRDIIHMFKEKHLRIPMLSYVVSVWLRIEEWLRGKLRNNLFLRKIYFNLKLDEKKYGMSTAGIRGNDNVLKKN